MRMVKTVKSKIKVFIFTFLCSVLMISSVVSGDVGVTSSLKVASGSVDIVKSCYNDACDNAGFSRGIGILSFDTTDNLILFKSFYYTSNSYDKRCVFMESLLKGIKSSSLGPKEKNKIYNFIASQDTEVSQALKYLTEDTSADLVQARKWLAPFTGGISTFTGLLTLLVFLFLGIGLLVDVAYLALPSLQLILERGDDKKKPFGVSAEAWRVNKEIASDFNNTKNEISEYLKKRTPVIIVCAICIGYLISGKVYEILAYLANAFGA